MDLFRLTLTEAADGLRRRRFSCAEYAAALSARTRACAGLNAYVAFDEEALMAAAVAADARMAGKKDPRRLEGVPIALKDNIDTVEFPTTACTGALQGRVPPRSAVVVARLQAAGALVAGKTNMHELAFGVTSNNSVTGPTLNPHDTRRIAGGSSGGSAAVVAAGMVPASLGTDTGASVRLPAALCGVMGFRPTHGRYPGGGVIPISHTRDTVGPMARTVGDIALLDSILSGEQANPLPFERSLRNLRLGIAWREFWTGTESSLATVVEAALERFAAIGVTLVKVDASTIVEASRQAGPVISRFEFMQDLGAYLRGNGYDLSLDQIESQIGSPDVSAIVRPLLRGQRPSTSAYTEALRLRQEIQGLYSALFRDKTIDALVLPTSILPAAPLGADSVVSLNGTEAPTFETFNRNTAPASVAGIPGISIPAGLTSSGLPVGIELDSPAGSDRRLLAIAQDLACALPHMPQAASPPALPNEGRVSSSGSR